MDSSATKRTPKAVQLALQNLPIEVGGTYKQAMERIQATNADDREIIITFLLWVALSTGSLKVAEIEHTSYNLGSRMLDVLVI